MARKVNRRLIHGQLHFILVYSESHQSSCKSTKSICFKKVTEPGSCRMMTYLFMIYWLCLHLAQDGLWKPLYTHWNPCKHVRPLINNLKNHIILKLGNFVIDIVFYSQRDVNEWSIKVIDGLYMIVEMIYQRCVCSNDILKRLIWGFYVYSPSHTMSESWHWWNLSCLL